MTDVEPQRAAFTRMDQSTKDDWDIIMTNLGDHARSTVADDHEFYDHCVEFCAKYDMPAFDPEGVTPPLSHYEPLIRATFSR